MAAGNTSLRLVALNIEGERHLARVHPFLSEHNPDIITLTEAPAHIVATLTTLGYHTTFAPMVIQQQAGKPYEEGVLLATKAPHTASIHYYYRPAPHLLPHEHGKQRERIAQVVIFADTEGLHIATTHFTWNPNGETASLAQQTDLPTLLAFLQTQPSHILCGDFNIPRGINSLYNDLTKHYTDTIPLHHQSSLDQTLHRLGALPAAQKLFTSFMVDYLFTQPPYTASDVNLHFGVSDHAAVTATILNTNQNCTV